MFFLGVAVDYDGTIAQNGRVAPDTVAALERVRASARRLVLVTGRQLEPLIAAFPQYRLFDRLVLENGAVLHAPAEERTEVLSAPPDARLVKLLRDRTNASIEVGRSIVAGWEPHQAAFLDAVRELGLELQIIFNKGALMLLPTGVNKASGLRAAAKELNVNPSAFVGVGDAENDHSFLSICGCSCAVSNAIDSLKVEVDIVAPTDHGVGVGWLTDQLLHLDSEILQNDRHGLPIGANSLGIELRLPAHQGNVLVVGPSGVGKSSLATLICEAASHRDLGFSAIDPEGDYAMLEGAGVLDIDHAGSEVIGYDTLLRAHVNPVLVLRGIESWRRAELMRSAARMAFANNALSGHPAFLVIDEAHEGLASSPSLPLAGGPCVVLLTLSPKLLSIEVLQTVRTVIALGADAPRLLAEFCNLTGAPLATWNWDEPSPTGLMWRLGSAPVSLAPYSPKTRHIRHAGKYAAGDVGRERSFYFRGADNQYLEPAKNLFEFIEGARRLPLDVWAHHLRNGDISRWFRSVVRDNALADQADFLSQSGEYDAAESLTLLSGLIHDRYCLPPVPSSQA